MLTKGMSTSIWIWIIGGLAVAMVTFTMTFQSLVSVGEASSRNDVVDQFNNLKNTGDLYCSKSRGSLTTEEVTLNGVRGIYTSNSKQNPPAEIPKYISESRSNSGDYLCLKFEGSNEPYQCKEMSCRTNMTYIGTPLEGSDMYILGEETAGYSFDLTIEKKSDGSIDINAEHEP